MHRLRDLAARQRWLVLAIALALVAPFAASVINSARVDWTPSNDEALIALRVHEVFSAHPPLTGQPSTASHYVKDDPPPRHPGPIEFYLLAPTVKLLGSDLGMPIGVGIINAGSVLIAAWVVFRRGGVMAGLLGSVVISSLAWSEGPALLTDPISSNAGGIPMLALAALAWAIVDGDIRLLPLTALVLAYVAQQHLAVLGVALGISLYIGLGVLLSVVAWLRWRRTRAGTDPPTDPVDAAIAGVPETTAPVVDDSVPDPVGPLPWILGAVGVSLVAWLPVLIDQLWGSGNISRMGRFAQSSEREVQGFWSGVHQGLRALGAPPLVLRTRLSGVDMFAPLSKAAIAGSLLVIVALVAIAVLDRRRNRSRATLAVTALVTALIGAYNGTNVPASLEAQRINFYRWMFVTSVLAWIALLWALGSWLARRRAVAERSPQLRPIVAGVALVAIALIPVASIGFAGPRVRRDQALFDFEHTMNAKVAEATKGKRRVLVIPLGASAVLATAPPVALELVEQGHVLGVPRNQDEGYGDRNVEKGDYDAAVVIVSATDPIDPLPGKLVARLDLDPARAARAEAADQIRGQDVVVSPNADEVLRGLHGEDGLLQNDGQRAFVAQVLASLADDPEEALRSPVVLEALKAGYFTSPVIDPDLLDELIANPAQNSWKDSIIEAWVLTPEQLKEFRNHD
ncbi:hypothetical protein [Aquihabitans sp. McL0605]|uniref:hypothetical protein n=1 Tax=Aquihabitans sp. McL0605 TaxID=3415671 RepID=UPI003CF699C3